MYEDDDLCGSDLEENSGKANINPPEHYSDPLENQSGSEPNNSKDQANPDDDSIAPGCDLCNGDFTDNKPVFKDVKSVKTDPPDIEEPIVTINPNSDILSSSIAVTRNLGKWFFIAAGIFIGIMLLFQIVPYISAISSIEKSALRWICI